MPAMRQTKVDAWDPINEYIDFCANYIYGEVHRNDKWQQWVKRMEDKYERPIHEMMQYFWEVLDSDERKECLYRAEFSGIADIDSDYAEHIRLTDDRKWMLGMLDDAVYNNTPDYDNVFNVVYEDGRMVSTQDFSEPTKLKRSGMTSIIGNMCYDDCSIWVKNRKWLKHVADEYEMTAFVNGNPIH